MYAYWILRMWLRAANGDRNTNSFEPRHGQGRTSALRQRTLQAWQVRRVQEEPIFSGGSWLYDAVLDLAFGSDRTRLWLRMGPSSRSNGRSPHSCLRTRTWSGAIRAGARPSLQSTSLRQSRSPRASYSCGECEPGQLQGEPSQRSQDPLPEGSSLLAREYVLQPRRSQVSHLRSRSPAFLVTARLPSSLQIA